MLEENILGQYSNVACEHGIFQQAIELNNLYDLPIYFKHPFRSLAVKRPKWTSDDPKT